MKKRVLQPGSPVDTAELYMGKLSSLAERSRKVSFSFPPPPQTMQTVANKVIVIIDDSPTIRTLLKIWFKSGGFEIEAFEDGIAFFR